MSSDPPSVGEEFDYSLPDSLIAHTPAAPRDAARLLVLDRATQRRSDRSVADLDQLLRPGDLLVVNDTKVLPARVIGRKPTGGSVEVLFIEPCGPEASRWRALLRSSRSPSEGQEIELPGGERVRVVEPMKNGESAIVEFDGESVWEFLHEHGRMPLPPYIKREADRSDESSYQCVYAANEGAVAAPTAGLHFTDALMQRLGQKGIDLAKVTLHVGEATFRSPRVGESLSSERFRVGEEVCQAIEATRGRGGRVVAVGTTVVRSLESCSVAGPRCPQPREGRTDLIIDDRHEFRFVDALMTNFHLPRTTLLMLVCAFGGKSTVLDAYAHAIAQRYRFYSYGDAMLIE